MVKHTERRALPIGYRHVIRSFGLIISLCMFSSLQAQPGTLTFVEYARNDSNGVGGLAGCAEQQNICRSGRSASDHGAERHGR